MHEVLHAKVEAPQPEASKRDADNKGQARGERVCGIEGEECDGEAGGEELEVDEPETCANGADAAHEERGSTCGTEFKDDGDEADGGYMEGA